MKRTINQFYFLFIALFGAVALWGTFFGQQNLLTFYPTFTDLYRGMILLGISILVVISLGALGVFLFSLLNKQVFQGWMDRIVRWFNQPRLFLVMALLLLFVSGLAGQWLLSLPQLENQHQRQLILSLTPFLLWISASGILSVVWIGILGEHGQRIFSSRMKWTLVAAGLTAGFLVFLTQLAGMGFTKSTPVLGTFQPVGFPLLGYQVLLAWIGSSLGMIGLWGLYRQLDRSDRKISPFVVDGAIAALLFGLAFFLWNTAPLEHNYFVDIPRPPNFEHYPNSDALYYDINAQNLLGLGEYWDSYDAVPVGRRPVMLLLHTSLHALGGLSYEAVIPYLIGVLSLLPVVMYALGRALHSRWAGALAGVLLIIRHRNGLLLAEVITGSNVKMIMSELPVTLGIVSAALLFVLWAKDLQGRKVIGLVGGAAVGLCAMIRIENILLLPFFSLPLIFVLRKRIWAWVRMMMIPALGLILVISPWVIRNWHVTGELFLDEPGNKTGLIIRTLQLDRQDEEIPELPGNNSCEQQEDAGEGDGKEQNNTTGSGPGSNRLIFLDQDYSGTDSPLETSPTEARLPGSLKSSFLSKDPPPFQTLNWEARDTSSAGLIVAKHLVSSVVESVLYLPTAPLGMDLDFLSRLVNQELKAWYGGFFYSPEKYVRSLPYWWIRWDGRIASSSYLGFGAVIFLIILGLSASYKKRQAAAFLPLGAMFSGVLAFSLIRWSGARFLQKADWVTSFYLALGLVDLAQQGLRWWGSGGGVAAGWEAKVSAGFQRGDRPVRQRKRLFAAASLGILLVGSVLPAAEIILPDRYPSVLAADKLETWVRTDQSSVSLHDLEIVDDFLADGAEVVYGRALYPRYFEPGEKLRDQKSSWEVPGIDIHLVGTESVRVVLPSSDRPESFPSGQEVLAVGCRRGTYHLDALFLVLGAEEGEERTIVWREEPRSSLTGCPLSRPY